MRYARFLLLPDYATALAEIYKPLVGINNQLK